MQNIQTLKEFGCKLKCVDKLRVETRRHFYTHAAQEQPQVHETKVRFLVPWNLDLCQYKQTSSPRYLPYLVLRNHARDDRIGGTILDRHVVGGARAR